MRMRTHTRAHGHACARTHARACRKGRTTRTHSTSTHHAALTRLHADARSSREQNDESTHTKGNEGKAGRKGFERGLGGDEFWTAVTQPHGIESLVDMCVGVTRAGAGRSADERARGAACCDDVRAARLGDGSD
eukprot:463918-Pleurochrysis_carterae.AAC.4